MSVLAGPTHDSDKHVWPKREYVTNTETCEFTYEWTIKKFSQYSSEIIESSNFSSNFSDFNDVWILEVNPSKGYYDYRDRKIMEYVSLRLTLKSFNDTSRLTTKCRILTHGGISIHKIYDFFKFPKESDWIKCISRYDLLKYLPNDELKISCTMMISKVQENSVLMSTLNEQSADVTIKVGRKSFRAIKRILAARSPVFAAMFYHEQFIENINSEVVIEDIEDYVFNEFIQYIYTDDTKNVDKMPMELLEVAEKYQVDCLKNICEKIICGTINLDNVTSILSFSDKYNAKKLNEKCLKFEDKNFLAVSQINLFKYKKKHNPRVEAIAGVN